MGDSETLRSIEQSMTVIRRRQNRRSLNELVDLQACERQDLGLIPALEAVEEQERQATVGTVASSLGLDPSRASRVVAIAVKAGYVTRIASQSDGRRINLALTADGKTFVDYAHAYRQNLIDRAMTGWPHRDRTQFVRLLTRFTQALNAEVPDPG